jgi:predicted NAD/FAD-dependent oxidoreductase
LTQRVVVVGAGLSGIAAAGVLRSAGWAVRLVEKSPGFGGRLATRRVDGDRYDHGAAFLTVRDPAFRRAVDPLVTGGLLRPWADRLHRWEGGRLVSPTLAGDGVRRLASPEGMAAVASALLREAGLEESVERACVVRGLGAGPGGWTVAVERDGTTGRLEADAVVVAVPAPQAALLARTAGEAMPAGVIAVLEQVTYDPCLALMATYEAPAPTWRAVAADDGPLSWVGCESSKRPSSRVLLTVHAASETSRAMWDASDEEVSRTMRDALAAMLGEAWRTPLGWQLKRWRYARPVRLSPARCVVSESPPVVFCGDWAVAPRAEGAWLSGLAAAERLVGLSPSPPVLRPVDAPRTPC